ncbi:hypothetical protein EJB05_28478, partial [Eragrostis curvula]
MSITSFINLLHVSLTFTSATVSSATTNSAPVLTFCFATLFRMEVLKLRSSSGITKLSGVGLCLAGVFIIAFYAGPELRPVNHHHTFTHMLAPSNSPSRVTWIKGAFLMVLASMHGMVPLDGYAGWGAQRVPAQDACDDDSCFLVAVVAERDFSMWKLPLDVGPLAVIYGGFVMAGLTVLPASMVHGDEGPGLHGHVDPTIVRFHIILLLIFLGRNRPPWQLAASTVCCGPKARGMYKHISSWRKRVMIYTQDEKGGCQKGQEEKEIILASKADHEQMRYESVSGPIYGRKFIYHSSEESSDNATAQRHAQAYLNL